MARWTSEEDKLLADSDYSTTMEAVNLLSENGYHRSKSAVSARRSILKLPSLHTYLWSKEELSILHSANEKALSVKETQVLLAKSGFKRRCRHITEKRSKLGLGKSNNLSAKKMFSKKEISIITSDRYTTIDECQTLLRDAGFSRTISSVCTKRYELGITSREFRNNAVFSSVGVVLDEDSIVDMYVDKRMTAKQVASEMGCTIAMVFRRLKKLNVERRTFGESSTINLDEDLIVDMYLNKNMSSEQIASKMGCSGTVICRRLRGRGIKLRSSKMDIDENLIINMYVNKKMSSKQIADRMSCSTTVIRNRLIETNTQTRPASQFGYVDDWTYDYPVKFGSGWEAHVYKILSSKNRHFLFQGEFGDRKEHCTPKFSLIRPSTLPTRYAAKTKDTYLWHPDFVIPELKVIIEVKGGWKVRQRWNQCIIPCIKATPSIDYKVYEMRVDPYDIQSLKDLKQILKRVV